MTALLSLSHVSKSFAGVHAVQDVSFDLPEHGCMGLIGPNGAGKTTMFNLISGVYPVTEGQITLDGQDITHSPLRRRAGMGITRSFQNIRLLPRHTVLENVLLGQHCQSGVLDMLRPIGLSGVRRDRAMQTLEMLGLAHHARTEARGLSYGIRKQVEIARALQPGPRLLLLDEPAAGLNENETAELAETLVKIRETGVAQLIVEHDLGFVDRLADSVVVLNFGRLIASGTLEEVRGDSTFRAAYLGEAS